MQLAFDQSLPSHSGVRHTLPGLYCAISPLPSYYFISLTVSLPAASLPRFFSYFLIFCLFLSTLLLNARRFITRKVQFGRQFAAPHLVRRRCVTGVSRRPQPKRMCIMVQRYVVLTPHVPHRIFSIRPNCACHALLY